MAQSSALLEQDFVAACTRICILEANINSRSYHLHLDLREVKTHTWQGTSRLDLLAGPFWYRIPVSQYRYLHAEGLACDLL